MLTTKTIEEVKERIVIEDIVKEYIAIKKSGRNYVCCCPFHNERTPSFFIFPDKNCFRCVLVVENLVMEFPSSVK